MVRCKVCKKSFSRGRGESWHDNMCSKCWLFGGPVERYFPPALFPRLFTTDFDRYLDLYTWHELESLRGT